MWQLKYSKCHIMIFLVLSQNSTQNVTSEILKMWQTQNVTKFKKNFNSKCDKSQKLKLWPNLQIQNATKLKITEIKKKKIWLLQKSKNQTLNSKLKNSKCDNPKTQNVTKLNSNCNKNN